jgi:hypothetical protein
LGEGSVALGPAKSIESGMITQALAAQLRDAAFDALGVAMDAHSVADIRPSADEVAASLGEVTEEASD